MQNTGIQAIQSYKDIQARLRECEAKLRDKGIKADEILKNIEDKLSNFNPQIMLYGQFNSGKSTLLNALFGKELAKMADKPETAENKDYTYNNYTIWDTPGLDARSDHSSETSKHYKKCELIIFVLSGDGAVEAQSVYEKIEQVINDEKPIIIVLNNKSGYDLSSEEIDKQKNAILNNLTKIKLSKEQIEKIPLIALNALSALKAKLENKSLLLEKSNILELESIIQEQMEKVGLPKVINVLNQNIREFIEESLKLLSSQISDEDVKKNEKLLDTLTLSKTNALSSLKSICEETKAKMEQRVRDIILTDEDLSNEELQKEIKAKVEEIIKESSAQIEAYFKELSKELEYDVQIFIKDSISNANFEGAKFEEGIFSKLLENEDLKKILEKTLAPLLMGAITFLLTKIPALAKFLPPIVSIPATIISTAFMFFTDSAEEKAKKRANAAKNKAHEIAFSVYTNLWSQLENDTNKFFEELISEIEKHLTKLNAKDQDIKELKNELELLGDKLPILSTNKLKLLK